MVLFFSGTGNSEYCARFIADRLSDECLDLSEKIKNKDFSLIESSKPFVVCAPTYAWRLPAAVTDFVEKTEFSGNDEFYFVMTCGGEIGNASKYNRALCEKTKKQYMGTAKVKMAENYLAMFDVTTEEEEALLMKEADVTLGNTVNAIAKGLFIDEVKEGALSGILSGPVNVMFNKYYLRDEKFIVKDSCTSCGLCKKLCPLGNIEIKNGRPLWLGNCTHCMACICHCPAEAIEYGKKSVGKRRYICRKYEA